jgi:hypothetical protein
VKRLIERATQRAVELERLLDDRVSALVRRTPRPLEPLEIRHAILKEIELQVMPGPNGTRVFPYDEITIELLWRTASENAALEAMLESEGGLHAEASARLAERGCAVPTGFVVHTVPVAPRPSDWASTDLYRVRFRRSSRRQQNADRAPCVAVITTSPPSISYRITEPRVDIGRVAEVRDRDGRMVRRNALVFSEEHDPRGTVSRRHAHITCAVAGGATVYTLYDDGSRYGTRIVRQGLTIPVHPGTVGVKLRDGDELHFGEAIASLTVA